MALATSSTSRSEKRKELEAAVDAVRENATRRVSLAAQTAYKTAKEELRRETRSQHCWILALAGVLVFFGLALIVWFAYNSGYHRGTTEAHTLHSELTTQMLALSSVMEKNWTVMEERFSTHETWHKATNTTLAGVNETLSFVGRKVFERTPLEVRKRTSTMVHIQDRATWMQFWNGNDTGFYDVAKNKIKSEKEPQAWWHLSHLIPTDSGAGDGVVGMGAASTSSAVEIKPQSEFNDENKISTSTASNKISTSTPLAYDVAEEKCVQNFMARNNIAYHARRPSVLFTPLPRIVPLCEIKAALNNLWDEFRTLKEAEGNLRYESKQEIEKLGQDLNEINNTLAPRVRNIETAHAMYEWIGNYLIKSNETSSIVEKDEIKGEEHSPSDFPEDGANLLRDQLAPARFKKNKEKRDSELSMGDESQKQTETGRVQKSVGASTDNEVVA
ncbi:unnamed protein product [Amoebophrya sp. A120]|nr:unnamed protein product [Amoebophrya sp. A120]|eukprot:GSA120T00024308001.1